MGWVYRLVSDGQQSMVLTEVHVDASGSPDGYLPEGCRFAGANKSEVLDGLEKAMEAFHHPVLIGAEIKRSVG